MLLLYCSRECIISFLPLKFLTPTPAHLAFQRRRSPPLFPPRPTKLKFYDSTEKYSLYIVHYTEKIMSTIYLINFKSRSLYYVSNNLIIHYNISHITKVEPLQF